MRSLHDGIKKINKKHLLIFILMLASMGLYHTTNKPIGEVRILALPYDMKIPLIKEFVLVYNFCYPFMIINMVRFLIFNQELFVESAISISLGNIMVFFTFILFQTEVPRPDIMGNDLFSQLLRLTYRLDRPFNGFPSLHVLTTVIILLAILKSRSSKGYKIFSIILCSLILLSTLFIKQHTLLDVLGGLIYASASYIFVAYVIQLKSIKKGLFRE